MLVEDEISLVWVWVGLTMSIRKNIFVARGVGRSKLVINICFGRGLKWSTKPCDIKRSSVIPWSETENKQKQLCPFQPLLLVMR